MAVMAFGGLAYAAIARQMPTASMSATRASPVQQWPSAPPSCSAARAHDLDPEDVSFLAQRGITIRALDPLGAEVRGLDLRTKPDEPVLERLQMAMAVRGFVVFKQQGVLDGDEQVEASEYWGGRRIHSTHGVHPKAPNRHIFRLANDRAVGILGVGPQWHNDGSFERGVFSHVGYHIVRVAEGGGGTIFAHQGAAFDALPPAEQERWERLVSVNSNSGVAHPVVHEHPISGRKSVYLHLGMTGAVLEATRKEGAPAEADSFRLLDADEMRHLFQSYNALLNAGFAAGKADLLGAAPRYGAPVTIGGLATDAPEGQLNGAKGVVSGVLDRRNGRVAVDVVDPEGAAEGAVRVALLPENLSGTLPAGSDEALSAAYTAVYEYEEGDCIFIDNLAVAHRATPEAHLPAAEVGLRILHRTTIRAMNHFDPPFGLPPRMDIGSMRSPYGPGVWEGGGLGFRWDETIPMQN